MTADSFSGASAIPPEFSREHMKTTLSFGTGVESSALLLSWLERHIKAYEEQFGKIPSPPIPEEPPRPPEGMYG